MDIQAKKCDVCGRVEHGFTVKGWFGYCMVSGGVFLGGPLNRIEPYLAKTTFGKVNLYECCSYSFLIKAQHSSVNSSSESILLNPIFHHPV